MTPQRRDSSGCALNIGYKSDKLRGSEEASDWSAQFVEHYVQDQAQACYTQVWVEIGQVNKEKLPQEKEKLPYNWSQINLRSSWEANRDKDFRWEVRQ